MGAVYAADRAGSRAVRCAGPGANARGAAGRLRCASARGPWRLADRAAVPPLTPASVEPGVGRSVESVETSTDGASGTASSGRDGSSNSRGSRRHNSGRAMPMCPLRPGDACSLCVPGATGPADCPTVRLVMEDPDLREMLHEKRMAAKQAS